MPPSDTAELEVSIGRAMLAQSKDCVKLIGRDGTLQFVSESGRCLLEFEPDAVPIGKAWTELWPSETRPIVDMAVKAAAAGSVERFTAFAPTRRGTPKWWDVVVTPLHNSNGTIDRLLSISRDVTQQMDAETSLRKSEQRFRGLADKMAQLAWMADAMGNVFWYNQRWLDYCGLSAEQLGGAGWKLVHHPDYVDRVAERVALAFKSGQPWEEVLPLRAANGDFRWFLTRAMPVTDDAGDLVLWCTTHTDITEQRNLSQRLRQLARMVELSHEAIFVWDLETGIVLWNNGCEELYGFTRADALGRRSHELLSTRHPMGVDKFEQILRREGEWSGEILHRAKDRTDVWVESRQELIRSGGRDLVIETNRDVSERRKADELRELLVGELDHRVKNTLAVVQSIAAQTARTQLDIPAFMARFSGRIQSLAAAQSILSDAHWSGAELAHLIRSQVELVSGDGRQLTLEGRPVLLPPEPALQMTLIIHELAANALRHGALAVPSGRVDVAWSVTAGDKRQVMIEWQEHGGPPVLASAKYGFGRRLIERAGRLPYLRTSLELVPEGARCRIWLDLPAEPAAERGYFNPRHRVLRGRMIPAESRQFPTPGRRVLVIEDDPLEALWMEEALADAGFHAVRAVRSTEAALDAMRSITFDFAILDLTSQSLDGPKIRDAIQQHQISLVTLMPPGTVPEPGGPGLHLAKPVTAQILVDALRAVPPKS